MTDLLKHTLHAYADEEPAPRFDVDTIARDGDRRLRRSRLTATLAAAGVAGVAIAGGLVVPGLLDAPAGDRAAATPPPYAERAVAFAVEDVVHYGRRSFSVGLTVSSFVVTDHALVLTSGADDRADGVVWRYAAGGATRIGNADGDVLRADDTGSLVSWADSSGSAPVYVVYDTSTGSVVARVPARTAPGQQPEVFALDDGAVYWRTAEGIVRYDVEPGTTQLVRADLKGTGEPGEQIELVDASAGRIAFVEQDETTSTMRVGTSMDDSARAMPTGWHGVLSPDGAYLGVEEADELAVYDTGTTEDVTPALPGYSFKVVYGWVDADTAMVLGLESADSGDYVADFLACEVPAGTCEVVTGGVELGATPFALPVGEPMDG